MKAFLHLEDSPRDAELIGDLLHREWPRCRIQRVASRTAFHAALERGGHDLILSDYSLPDIDGLAALDLARALRPDTPFIFMSGTIGEERAVEALKHGAVDYVIKDRPERLLSAMHQALKLVEETAARRRADEALRINQERHRLLVEHARDAIFALSDEGVVISLNLAFEQITGWPREQWLGRVFHDLVHPDDLADALSRFAQARQGERVGAFELRVNAAAGRVVDLEFTLTAHVPGLGVMGIARDISERKLTLTRLREQAEIIDRAPVAVIVTDLAHRVIYANDGAQQLYGLRRDEMMGRTGDELFAGETMRGLGPARTATLMAGAWRGEVPVHTRDGRRLSVEFFMSLIGDERGRPRARLSVGIDVTEKRKLETQVQRAARLDSIGMLAGGIAHDLNNVLAPIQMGVELLRGAKADPMTDRVLRNIETSARYGTNLVRQLMAFARGGEVERVETALAPLVKDVGGLLAGSLPRGIEVRTECVPDLAPVLADGTQLKQILINLCINARDAMPHGGRITLEAARATPAELARHAPAAAGRPHVRLSVTDTGTGMTPEVQAKLFEPFFTTKEAGKGTGLGLSTVQSLVRKHDGFIGVESEPGRGSAFHIFLPKYGARAAGPDGAPPGDSAEPDPGQGPMVLVVECEPAHRAALGAALGRHGYRVAAVAGGEEALDWLQLNRGRASAVVMSGLPPGDDGPALRAALPVLDPALRVINAADFPAPPAAAPGAPRSHSLLLPALLNLLPRPATGAA